jgi:sulfopyruvate decarboxylase TPP-binding subunit
MSNLTGRTIIEALEFAGIEYVLSVPDITTSENVLKPLIQESNIQVIQVCKEDEGISIAAGLYATNKKSVVLIQHTGLLDSINCLRAVSMEIKNPTVLLVGLLRHEPGIQPKDSTRYGVQIITPILDSMNIPYSYIEKNGEEQKISKIIKNAYKKCQPHIILIGGEPK